MGNVHIYRLPKSTDPEILEAQIPQQVEPLRALRLKTLQSDPQKFHSKYEDERGQSIEFWLNRIRPPFVQHSVAVASNEHQKVELQINGETEFLDCLVLINEWAEQRYNSQGQGDAEAQDQQPKTPTYFLGAVAVDASVRGQGLGSSMIRQAIQFVREDAKSLGVKRVRIRLAMMQGNERAGQLYRRLGFTVDQHPRREEMETGTEIPMSLIMEVED